MKLKNLSYFTLVITLCAAVFLAPSLLSSDSSNDVSAVVLTPSEYRCEQVKRMWDTGNFTSGFANLATLNEASLCKNEYHFADWYTNTSGSVHDDWDRCRTVKRWWDLGNWTSTLGNLPSGGLTPGQCKESFYTAGQWSNNTSDSSLLSGSRCIQIKKLWELDNYTSRFVPSLASSYEASSCKYNYWSHVWWSVTLYQPTSPSWDRCEAVKDLWDAGNWTSRFGSTSEPKACKDNYFSHSTWTTIQNPIDPTINAERCKQIKIMWETGSFTALFTPHLASLNEASSCKEAYYSYNWDVEVYPRSYDDPSYYRCEQVKRWWDYGNWTSRFGSTSEASACKRLYFGYSEWDQDTFGTSSPSINRCEQVKRLWEANDFTARFSPWLVASNETSTCKNLYWGHKWWGQTLYNDEPSIDRCEIVKELWDEGDWTSRFGSVSEPSDCKELYFTHSNWRLTSPLGENEPPAGYEDDVRTYYIDNPFPDTDITSLEGIAAAELYRRAVIGGYPDGEFKGYKTVNRAEAAKFLLLARFGFVGNLENNGQFPDVIDGEWYTRFVVKAAMIGIINGYDDGYFRPADPVNTAEFLKMLTLTFDLELNLDHAFTDFSSNVWFDQYAGIVPEYDLLPKRSSTILGPERLLTRDEIAVAIYHYLLNR